MSTSSHSERIKETNGQKAKRLLEWMKKDLNDETAGMGLPTSSIDYSVRGTLPYRVAMYALEKLSTEGGELPLLVISDLDRLSRDLKKNEHLESKLSGRVNRVANKMLDEGLVSLTSFELSSQQSRTRSGI